MRHNLTRAADHFALTIAGEPIFGWRLRSISAGAANRAGPRWLRVVSQESHWARGIAWTGTVDANDIAGIAKPSVLDVYEWSEQNWRDQRAEVMTIMPGEPCSPTDVLRREQALQGRWWSDLRRSLDSLATTSTQRVNADADRVSGRIRERFGAAVDTTVTQWSTCHGDLHWSNLLHDPFGLLDWELWGRAPAGTDAATLLCYSLLTPATANKIRSSFADLLDTSTGRTAQLYVIARLLRRIDGGDHPDLAEPLARHACTLLAT
ncbi:MAG: phosphotransferase [Pseudonocardiaceae bacterium]